MALLEDLVAAYRILAEHEIIDAYGHVSARSEERPDRYFMSRSLAPELVTEADIQEYDLDSKPVDPNARDSVLERYIHGEIFKTRPDVMAVVHNHSPSVVPFSITSIELKPLFHMAAFIGEGVPNFEIRDVEMGSDLLVRTTEMGAALAKTLSDKPAALMRGHGAVVVADSLHVVVAKAYYLNVNARMQLQAMQLRGDGGVGLSVEESKKAAQTYERSWDAWKSRLRR